MFAPHATHLCRYIHWQSIAFQEMSEYDSTAYLAQFREVSSK